MARKTETVIIDAEGRDKGKVFVITEMPASKAEKWAARALLALGRSGVDVPDNIAASGLAGVVALGVRSFLGLRFEDAEPLLDEMFASCVAIVPDPDRPTVTRGAGGIGALIEDDIEEVSTRIHLRTEVLELHTGFSIAAVLSVLMIPAVAKESGDLSNTSISPAPSEQ